MAEDAPVKWRCSGDQPRRRSRKLTVTTYVEWTLGLLREHTQHQVRTEFDREHEAIFARNSFDPQFAGWTAFHAITEPVTGYTASRRDFLGRNGTAEAPAALRPDGGLSGITGAGIDPCAALQCVLELKPGESRRWRFCLGAATARPSSGGASRIPRRQDGVERHCPNSGTLGRAALGSQGEDSGAYLRRDAQSVDALPGAGRPDLGSLGAHTRAAAPTASAISSRM